jgi:hypothetical protein
VGALSLSFPGHSYKVIVELNALPPVLYGSVYGIATLGAAQTAFILINGPYQWLGYPSRGHTFLEKTRKL